MAWGVLSELKTQNWHENEELEWFSFWGTNRCRHRNRPRYRNLETIFWELEQVPKVLQRLLNDMGQLGAVLRPDSPPPPQYAQLQKKCAVMFELSIGAY